MTYYALTKGGRLSRPKDLKEVDLDFGIQGFNWCGQVAAKVGDFINPTGRGISAGTTGRVLELTYRWVDDPAKPCTTDISAKMEFLDGKTGTTWLWYLTVIDYSAVQEVKDFYINDGRSDRIKVTW